MLETIYNIASQMVASRLAERSIIMNKHEEKINHCKNCDSASMEMCLLIKHCKYWTNPYKEEEFYKYAKTHLSSAYGKMVTSQLAN